MRSLTIRTLACLSPVLFSITQSLAQSAHGAITFTWGDEYELPRKHEDMGFLGNAKTGYVQIGHRSHESLTFQKFSPDLHLAGEKEVDLSQMPRDYTTENLEQIGDRYYWFFSTYDKGEDKESLFAQEISIENGDVKSSAREILSTDKLSGTLTMTGFYRFGLTDKWNFYNSFDHSKILVQYRKKPERRDDSRNNDIIGFQVFDSDLKKLWGREIRMPYTEEMMDNEDYQVDAKGNVYTLAKVYQERKSHDRKRPNYRYEILKWSADKQEVTKIPFRFSDRFVTAASIIEDGQGNIIVAGYYSGRGTGSGATVASNLVSANVSGGLFYNGARGADADGAFLLKLDENTNEVTSLRKGTYEFSAEVLKQYESRRKRRKIDRKEEKDNAEADNLHLRKVLVNDDGSIELYGEEDYIVVSQTTNFSSTGMGSTRTSVTYYFEDIIAMKINADGSLKWTVKIPKQQQGKQGTGGMSFKQYSFKGNSYLFFMDNLKNLEIEKDETPATHIDGAGGILMAVKIDENGKATKEQLYDVREEKVNLTVTDFDEVGNNQLIVRGRARHRESKAALITFN
jgi:hypothetical protein